MNIGFHLPFPRHNKTEIISIDTRLCKACGKCIVACPHQVLGMIEFGPHRHVHVDRASQCRGCGRCIRTCPYQAIRSRFTKVGCPASTNS